MLVYFIIVYLEENIQRLNRLYQTMPIRFEKSGDVIKVIESQPFYLNQNNELKNLLRQNYKMQFSQELKWHIGSEGIKELTERLLKTQPTQPINILQTKLFDVIQKVQEPELKISLQEYFTHHPRFFELPAAVYHHHAYPGGLLEHTIQVLEIVMQLKTNIQSEITTLNQDLLIAGSILHDIGKLNCYDIQNGRIGVTPLYGLQDHIVNGIAIVSKEIKSKYINEIIHIIASHHRLKDWGSPIEPKIAEAWLIYYADDLSSKIMG
jgi:putative nucleotidyltransferase with HDIG domain